MFEFDNCTTNRILQIIAIKNASQGPLILPIINLLVFHVDYCVCIQIHVFAMQIMLGLLGFALVGCLMFSKEHMKWALACSSGAPLESKWVVSTLDCKYKTRMKKLEY